MCAAWDARQICRQSARAYLSTRPRPTECTAHRRNNRHLERNQFGLQAPSRTAAFTTRCIYFIYICLVKQRFSFAFLLFQMCALRSSNISVFLFYARTSTGINARITPGAHGLRILRYSRCGLAVRRRLLRYFRNLNIISLSLILFFVCSSESGRLTLSCSCASC